MKTSDGRLALVLCSIAAVAAFGASWPERQFAEPTVVYIVRHAEKHTGVQLSDEEREDDHKVELTKEGVSRSETLAWMLRDIHFDSVHSTNYRRTIRTVAPTARQAKLTVQTEMAESGDLPDWIKADARAGQTLLVCGHSNTIPGLLRELGVPIGEKELQGYDDLFIVLLQRSSSGEASRAILQRLHYFAR